MTAGRPTVQVEEHGLHLVLAPGIGGSTVALSAQGVEILRAGGAAIDDPRALGAFPLVPFSGRIAQGRFRHGSRAVRLRANFPPEPHAIHGEGWQRAWQVDRSGGGEIALVQDYVPRIEGEDWPWAYHARQTFHLGEGGLSLVLELTNRSRESMPAGLGWHPYFRKAGASLASDVTAIWRSGGDLIPDRPSELDASCDLRSPRSVSTLDLDNAFTAGGGGSVLSWPERGLRVTLRASPELGYLVVYTPPHEDFFCVEPTSHAPDAVNSRLSPEITGLRCLEPGETLRAQIALEIELA